MAVPSTGRRQTAPAQLSERRPNSNSSACDLGEPREPLPFEIRQVMLVGDTRAQPIRLVDDLPAAGLDPVERAQRLAELPLSLVVARGRLARCRRGGVGQAFDDVVGKPLRVPAVLLRRRAAVRRQVGGPWPAGPAFGGDRSVRVGLGVADGIMPSMQEA